MIKYPSKDDIGKMDDRPATIARSHFTDTLSDLSQIDKAEQIEQTLLDLMDYTEQSDDEELWCRLYKEFEKIYYEIDNRKKL